MKSSEVLPLVSVIIPTYNYADYIGRAVDSALNQSYPEIEVLIIDDGSTDHTAELLAEYGDQIRVIYQDNRGVAAARNLGIREAKGEYISFLDADDCYLHDNISRKVAYLEHHKNYRWCYSDCVWKEENGRMLQQGSRMPQMLISRKVEGDVLDLVLAGALLGSNLFLFHREVLEAVGGFDEKLKVLEDYALYLFTAARFPLGYVDEVLVEVHPHENSLSQSGKWRGYISRWRINKRVQRELSEAVARVGKPWRRIQADVYRNLAELSYAKGRRKRAAVLLNQSLHYRCWQPGALLLWLKLI